eukprot:548020-Prymnesium_polylepis.1
MNTKEFAARWQQHGHEAGSTAAEALLSGVVRYAERVKNGRPAVPVFRKLTGDEQGEAPARLIQHDRERSLERADVPTPDARAQDGHGLGKQPRCEQFDDPPRKRQFAAASASRERSDPTLCGEW